MSVPSVGKSVLGLLAAGTLIVPVAIAGPASASPATASRAAASCSVFNYTGAHWATKVAKAAVVTHSYQLNLPHNGTYTETKSESNVRTVKSSVTLSASLKYSEDAIFESIEASAKATVKKFGSSTGSSSQKETVSIHNTGGQTSYVMFEGVTRFTGTAEYYNCVSHTKAGIGTVEVTHKAPWQTYTGAGGGAVQCGVKTTSALAKAAQAYC